MKTPEQMAMEYIKNVETARNPSVTATAFPQMQRCYVAGYQAAKDEIEAYKDGAKDVAKKLKELIAEQDQLADADKVMNSPNNSNGWISVKERLPIFRLYDQNNESGYTEDVLMRFVWGRIRISNFEKVDGIVTTGYGNNLNEVTYWMPLPKPPEEEK